MKRIALVVVALAARAHADPPKAAKVEAPAAVRAMEDELARTMDKLELPGVGKPYYVSYEMWDARTAHASASLGALTSSDAGPRRSVDIDVRLGSYDLDNSNFGTAFEDRHSIGIGFDDDYDAVRRYLWLATDAAYKAESEKLEQKTAILKQEEKDPDATESFSKEKPATTWDVIELATPDKARLEKLAKKLSAVFAKNPDVHRAAVTAEESVANRYFVSSEGAHAATPYREVRVVVFVSTQADDGMPLHDGISFTAPTFDKLPSEAEMLAQADALSKQMSAFRKAPVLDDYDGPVLFRGVAAAQAIRDLVAEDFSGTPPTKGQRAGGLKLNDSALVGKIGQRILPAGISVVDDPTIAALGAIPLTGHYAFDEEGIAPQRVSLVENGIFKRFLMSRIPRKGFEHSTGHGRSTRVSNVRAHPANLIVSSSKGISDRELVKRALATAKEQDLPYVIAVDRLSSFDDTESLTASMLSGGGASITRPAIIKQIYPDGHEVLVRGARFAGVQLQVLKDVVAVGTTPSAFHYVGSGLGKVFDSFNQSGDGIAITIVSPSLLFRDLDLKKPHGAQKKAPIAPHP